MINVITGPMFAGKSELLHDVVLSACRRGEQVYLLRPELDTRPALTTHSGKVLEHERLLVEREVGGALLYPSAPASSDVVVFDEAQFFDEAVVHWVNAHDARGLRVYVVGLDRDFRGDPFGAMKELIFNADYVTKLAATCRCGARATRTQRLVADARTVLVGAAEAYEPRCARCHVP